MTNHQIVLNFSGTAPTVLAAAATPLDSVMDKIISLADRRNLVSLKSNVDYTGDSPDDPDVWWKAPVLPAGMKECHLVKYPTVLQLNCSSPTITSDAAGILLEQLKAATSNSSAVLQSDSRSDAHRPQLYSPKGTSIRVWLSVDKNGGNSVDLLVDEPEP